MPIASYIFFVSLAGLLAMAASKWKSVHTGHPGFFSFLSRFDEHVSRFLLGFSNAAAYLTAALKTNATRFAKNLGQVLTAQVHRFLQTAERKVRAWREFARERKIERKPASAFINGVTEFKRELKQNGNSESRNP